MGKHELVPVSAPRRKRRYSEPPQSFRETFSEALRLSQELRSMLLMFEGVTSHMQDHPEVFWDGLRMMRAQPERLDRSIENMFFRSGYDIVAHA